TLSSGMVRATETSCVFKNQMVIDQRSEHSGSAVLEVACISDFFKNAHRFYKSVLPGKPPGIYDVGRMLLVIRRCIL
ncbi:MAG: hypothetical protein QNJ18_09000, partial [Xenococcaceae cyanobacterium MO_167.B52]|nr:hypothetical protein [Xenococcaceae cyanobacterium MO_167.B52]